MTRVLFIQRFFAHAGGWGWDEWAYVAVLPAVAVVALLILMAAGARAPGDEGGSASGAVGLVSRLPRAAERLTGFPGWAACVMAIAGLALVIAQVGFLWDVAWHIDMGRDKQLFTPAHTMIVIGLATILFAGLLGAPLATATRAPVALRVGPFRVPWSSLLLAALGAGALAGFPLDDLWHGHYGVDVTLWGPTHILMVSGASFATVALWLTCAEARISPREGRGSWLVHWALAGAVLTGFSTGQGEFDFGVPQFQQLYHPVLLAIASGCALVAARVVLGRGGAVAVAMFFLGIRVFVALLIHGAFNLTTPRFPLYLVSALAIEVVFAWAGSIRRLRLALASGLAIATVGTGSEWLWSQAWGRHPWNEALFPEAFLVGGLAAFGAAIVGVGLGGLISRASTRAPDELVPAGRTSNESSEVSVAWWRRDHAGVPTIAIVAACAAIVVALLVPFPRRTTPVTASLTLDRRGDEAVVHMRLRPDEAAREARWFEVISWQGGGLVRRDMRSTGPPGEYISNGTVPVTGDWKTLARLHRGSLALGIPVYLPRDPEIGAELVPAEDREMAMVRDVDLLLREARAGPVWPAVVAFGGIALVGAGWLVTFLFVGTRVGRTQARLDA